MCWNSNNSFSGRTCVVNPNLPVIILLSFTTIYHPTYYHHFDIICQPTKKSSTICSENLRRFSRLPFVSWSLLQAPVPCVTCCLLNSVMTRHPTTMRIAWQGHRHGHAWQPWCIITHHPGGNKMWVIFRAMEIHGNSTFCDWILDI